MSREKSRSEPTDPYRWHGLLVSGASGIVFALWDLLADRRVVAGFLELIVAATAFFTAAWLLSVSDST
jgi:hypothetical protein